MPKKFSIVFPTRGRTRLLMSLLNSIGTNTNNLENIEVLVAVDKDDFETQNFIIKLKLSWLHMHVVERSLNFSRDYYSYLASHSSGKWIIVCNDDTEFITKDWDLSCENVLLEYIKDGRNVVYGWIEDNLGSSRLSQHGNYCCFPLFGRDGYNALGYILPPQVPTWGADIWAEKLYQNIDRIVKLPMTISHISHHNGVRPMDEITYRISMNQVPFQMNPTYEEINKLIKAMRPQAVKSA